jgi:hypothetical protein
MKRICRARTITIDNHASSHETLWKNFNMKFLFMMFHYHLQAKGSWLTILGAIFLLLRMTELRLSQSEQKFEEFASCLDIPVMMVDKQDTIVFLNRRFLFFPG